MLIQPPRMRPHLTVPTVEVSKISTFVPFTALETTGLPVPGLWRTCT